MRGALTLDGEDGQAIILTQTIVTLGELTKEALFLCNPELEVAHILFLLTRHSQLGLSSTEFLVDALVYCDLEKIKLER